MNLVEKLMKADAKKADEREVGVFKSMQLSRILGEKGPVARESSLLRRLERGREIGL